MEKAGTVDRMLERTLQRTLLTCLAVVVTGLASIAGAQQPAVPATPPAPAAPHLPNAPGKAPEARKTPPQTPQQIRDKLRASIRALRAQKLAEVLKPDAATAAKLQEISEKYGDQVMVLHDQAGAARRDLVKQLQSPTPDQAAVTRLTEQLLSLTGRTNRLEEERMTAVKRVLTPVQFGRFLVAWPKINRQIQERIYGALAKVGEKRDTTAP